LKTLANACRVFVVRLARHGPVSAGVFARYLAARAWVRVENRRGRAPQHACPVCGWRGARFFPLDIGTAVLHNVACPTCESHDRHRMLHLWAAREDSVFHGLAGARVLHCAPEPCVVALLQNAGARIIATDLAPAHLRGVAPRAVAADGQALPFATGSVDLVVSLHVLEHIPDDRAAVRAYARVLRPGGCAVIMAPMYSGMPQTNDWGRPDPLLFDHFRTYSPHDCAARFAPLEVRLVWPESVLSADDRARYAIRNDEVIVLARAQA